MPIVGTRELWISPKKGSAGRWASLSISAAAVTIWSPQLNRTGRALRCWAVRAWEANPPEGAEPIEWMLLSSEAVENQDDALRIVDYYGCRWLIEEYHQCLKSGCKVEQRQLEDYLGCEATVEQLAEQMKLSVRQVQDLLQWSAHQQVSSLEAIVGQSEEDEFRFMRWLEPSPFLFTAYHAPQRMPTA